MFKSGKILRSFIWYLDLESKFGTYTIITYFLMFKTDFAFIIINKNALKFSVDTNS